MIEGGSDTTSSFIQSLILALVAYPEVQKKAQEEIDRVIGSDRAPVLDDIENLPYCQAIILEVGKGDRHTGSEKCTDHPLFS